VELSIDTSTRYASVAVTDQGEAWRETSWFSKQNHTVELTSTIQTMLRQAGIGLSRLDAIFVAVGPGGFSALRVGLSVAKGISEGLDIPLIGVDTLQIEASAFSAFEKLICPVLGVGREQVAWGCYEMVKERWTAIGGPEIDSVESMITRAGPRAVFCGEGAWEHRSLLRELVPESVTVLSMRPPTRHASTLGELGFKRLKEGKYGDAGQLQPLYLRRPTITHRGK
jgi:tRNA threonylcarbamoyladenosine biosynthesis protein TsaB